MRRAGDAYAKELRLNLCLKVLVAALAWNGAAWSAIAEIAKPPTEKAEPAKSEIAKADQNRKKPLQRCDELKDKAQLDCLQKARERVVEARAKREAKGEKK